MAEAAPPAPPDDADRPESLDDALPPGVTAEAPAETSLYLTVKFWTSGAVEPSRGVLQAYSNHQVAFITPTPLTAGQRLRLAICTSGEAHERCTQAATAQVQRCNRSAQSYRILATWDYGREEQHDDRRDAQRKPTHMRGQYRRHTGAPFQPCRVLDISSSGMRILTPIALRPAETLFVRVDGTEDHPIHKSLLGEVTVMWSRRSSRTLHQAGCRFQQIKVREIRELE